MLFLQVQSTDELGSTKPGASNTERTIRDNTNGQEDQYNHGGEWFDEAEETTTQDTVYDLIGTWPMSSLHKWIQIVNKQLIFFFKNVNKQLSFF